MKKVIIKLTIQLSVIKNHFYKSKLWNLLEIFKKNYKPQESIRYLSIELDYNG